MVDVLRRRRRIRKFTSEKRAGDTERRDGVSRGNAVTPAEDDDNPVIIGHIEPWPIAQRHRMGRIVIT
jgi:hypothetical protein